MNCRVTFEQDEQKILVDFTLDEKNMLYSKVSFEPEITAPKQNMGLAGNLCDFFLRSIKNNRTSNEQSNPTEN